MGVDSPAERTPGAPRTLVPDEVTVVARARDGSVPAFEALVDHYQTPLFRYVYRLVSDRPSAEDIVQDSFVAAWRGLPTLGTPAAFRGWLYRIASNRAFDVLRARRPQAELPDEDSQPTRTLDRGSDDHDDPARVVVQRAQLDALQQALADLPPQQRAAWTLQKIDGLSYDEIAVALGLPVSTVRGRIARARQTLAEGMASWR